MAEKAVPIYFGKAMAEPSLCRALFDWNATDDHGLSFRAGDIIQVLIQAESGWWDGLLGETRGWFPSNYVVLIHLENSPEGVNLRNCSSTVHKPIMEPRTRPTAYHQARQIPRSTRRKHFMLGVLAMILLVFYNLKLPQRRSKSSTVPLHATEFLQKCHSLHLEPVVPPNFHARLHSDRFVPGTKPTILRNASIWTGEVYGLDVVKGDLLLENGLIKAVGDFDQSNLLQKQDLISIDLEGAWVSPGIVDMHSHLGVDSSPHLRGASDTNSLKGLILPWLRSLDGLNTHDEAYKLSISGGVTTALVLPGSADAIGGQAFIIKLRPTEERTPSSMLLEPPHPLNGTEFDITLPPRWRQMKHACGENPSRVYSGTRMDTIWAFRQGYETARLIKKSQDNYCTKALAGEWAGLGEFPESLQWEALVDVLRGRVKVHTHCYETVDLDGLVRLSNEFQFPIAAFHHAHETYLVPDLLKEAYGHPPAVAVFATNARYKRESYRGSEFAPRILAENGLKVVMKSDHPVLNSRYLLYEATQAHYYGLPENLALSAVTTSPATVLGQDHRIGYIREGYDADVVVWDSHPLTLGATPKQVWIDGIPQIDSPSYSKKPARFQDVPSTPNFDREARDALKYDGLPPIEPRIAKGAVVFHNVSEVTDRNSLGVRQLFSATQYQEHGLVVVDDGIVTCVGLSTSCSTASLESNAEWIDLQGGSISPGLVSFGSPLGLDEIAAEASTNDGYILDPFKADIPAVMGGAGTAVRAFDGLQFGGRDALLAYRAGVTSGVTAPKTFGFQSGLSTAFGTGSAHKLEKGAVIQEVTALHFSIKHSTAGPSVSTQIAALRGLLLENSTGQLSHYIGLVKQGSLPLVLEVHNADIMASLISIKHEVEAEIGSLIKMTFTGATEAHLLASEIGDASVGVVLTPARPFPSTWESRRILPGPPLTRQSSLATLLYHNVTVGIGIVESWSARSTRFDAAWAALETNGEVTKTEAIALASVNLENLLGVELDASKGDLVATKAGGLLDLESKVVGVISRRQHLVHLM